MNGGFRTRVHHLASPWSRRLLALVSAAVLAVPAFAQSVPAQAFAAARVTRPGPGIRPAGTARPARLAPSASRRRAGSSVVPFRTLDPAALRALKRKAGSGGPGPAPLDVVTTPTTGLYNNTNQQGISVGDEASCCVPPDTTGAIGPTRYVEIVNEFVRVYSRSLDRISDTDLNTFTSTPSSLTTSDPQLQWDGPGNRWLYTAVAFATGNNYLLVGWSKTSDPSDLANGWCRFGISTANLLQDYPKLGHDNNFLIVGSNEYDDSKPGEPFVTANIWALPKPAIGDTSCTVGSASFFADANHLLKNADGSLAFTPVPANTTDSSPTGYILAAHSPMNPPTGPQTRVMAWHMTVIGNGPRLVQDGDMTVNSFDIPPSIPQPGPSLDSLDARLTQAVARADPDAGNLEAVWTQHTVVSTTSRSVVRWYEFLPSQLAVRQQGEASSSTDFLFNGAISPSTLGNDAALFYDRANPSTPPWIGAVSRTHTDPLSTMEAELVIGTSGGVDGDFSCTSPYGPPCRWGDYSGASPDPSVAGTVWGSNQVNGPGLFGFPQWLTRNFAVQSTIPADFSLAISPTGRAATAPGSTTYSIAITDQGGFSGAVTLSAGGLPSGTTAAFSPNPATTTSTLTLTTASSTPAGTSLFTVTGVNGSLTHTAQITLVVTAPSTYANAITADSPNAYWRLGETSGTVMVDATANANNGTYAGGVTLNQLGAIAGDPNGAVLLDGSSGNGRAPSSPSLNLSGSISVEAWARFTATPTSTQDLVNKGDGQSATGTSYLLGYVAGCTGCGFGFYTFIGNGFTCACQASAPAAGRWLYLVGTRTASGQLALYVNGSLVASASDGGAALNSVAAAVGIGASGSGAGSALAPANATLDEVAIYPVALSASQVTNHYQASGIVPPPPGPPTNVSAIAGNNQATVSWSAPAGTITGYVATAYAGTSTRNSVAVAGSATSATLYGLQGGTSYTIQVRAVNAQGSGAPSTSNAVTPSGSPSTYTSTILGDGPALYYRLGDPSGSIAPDSSGNVNAGTYAGGVTLGQPGALSNDPDGAALLDGSTGSIRAPNSSSVSITGAISVEIWVRWTATPTTTQDLINKGDGATATGSAYMLGYVPGCSGCGLGFYSFIGNGFTCACQAGALSAGSWYHLVGTRTAAGQLAFYVNGRQVASANDGGGALNTVAAGVGIGATGSGSGSSLYPANAALDEAAIYPLALSATQIQNHDQASGNTSPPGAPVSVSATAGANQATVTWQPGSGGTAATAFIATALIGNTPTSAVAVDGASTSATVFGLRGGTPYTIQVTALNSNGSSPPATSGLITPTGAATTYASTVLADGPALYLRLSDPTGTIGADSSGNGNNAGYAGGVTLNQPGALKNDPDGALRLDGSTGSARAPSTASLSLTGAITLEVWVNWTAAPTSTQDLINKGDGATATGTSYMLGYVPGCAGCGLGLYTFIGNSFVCACQSAALPAGQWFHLVGTRTAGGQLNFYVNGTLVASASDGGAALNTVTAGVGIGATGSGSGSSLYPANATLDEAAIYPVALTATQVSTHYHAAGY